MRSSRSSTIIQLFASAVLAAGVSGCVTDEKYDLSSASALPELDDFAAGADQPPKPRTLYALAGILAQQGHDNQCQYVLLRTIHENPDFLPAYNDLAELYLRNDRTDKAVEALEAGLKRSEKDAVLHNNLGMCRMLQGHYAKAFESFKKAADLAPEEARYKANMATAIGMQKRYPEAFALYKEVMPAAEAHHNLAVICEVLKDTQRAVAERRRAEEVKGTD